MSMNMNMDERLRDAAMAHNAALPLEDWKARILARTEEEGHTIPEENVLAFAPRKKSFYQKALPYACAAAAVVVVFMGIGAMGGFSRLSPPAAQGAPAMASGADMAAVAEAPAAAAPAAPAEPAAPAAPMEAAEPEAFAIPDSLSEEANTYTTLEEPPVPAPAEPAAPAAPEASAADVADMEGGMDNGASASSRASAGIEAISGENRVSLTLIAPGTTPAEMAEQVAWLSIDPAAESVPFRLFLGGEETHGIYAIYDGSTFEALDFFQPSGLAPETYLFQNAGPGGRYVVTVYLNGELYAFGAEIL